MKIEPDRIAALDPTRFQPASEKMVPEKFGDGPAVVKPSSVEAQTALARALRLVTPPADVKDIFSAPADTSSPAGGAPDDADTATHAADVKDILTSSLDMLETARRSRLPTLPPWAGNALLQKTEAAIRIAQVALLSTQRQFLSQAAANTRLPTNLQAHIAAIDQLQRLYDEACRRGRAIGMVWAVELVNNLVATLRASSRLLPPAAKSSSASMELLQPLLKMNDARRRQAADANGEKAASTRR